MTNGEQTDSAADANSIRRAFEEPAGGNGAIPAGASYDGDGATVGM